MTLLLRSLVLCARHCELTPLLDPRPFCLFFLLRERRRLRSTCPASKHRHIGTGRNGAVGVVEIQLPAIDPPALRTNLCRVGFYFFLLFSFSSPQPTLPQHSAVFPFLGTLQQILFSARFRFGKCSAAQATNWVVLCTYWCISSTLSQRVNPLTSAGTESAPYPLRPPNPCIAWIACARMNE